MNTFHIAVISPKIICYCRGHSGTALRIAHLACVVVNREYKLIFSLPGNCYCGGFSGTAFRMVLLTCVVVKSYFKLQPTQLIIDSSDIEQKIKTKLEYVFSHRLHLSTQTQVLYTDEMISQMCDLQRRPQSLSLSSYRALNITTMLTKLVSLKVVVISLK